MCVISTISAIAGASISTALSIAATEAAVVGGILGTVGAVQQAEAQKAAAEYQAEVERENAKLASRQAEAEGLQGNQELNQLRQKMLATQSAGRAEYASSGVVLGAGVAADYEADIADAYDLDKRNLEYDIATRQYRLRVEAANSEGQSGIYGAQAKRYGQKAGMSLLSGSFDTVSSGVDTFGKTPLGKNLMA
jgi:hypothetical protein